MSKEQFPLATPCGFLLLLLFLEGCPEGNRINLVSVCVCKTEVEEKGREVLGNPFWLYDQP